MRAALYRATGPAARVLSVQDLPTPEPGRGQVRVRVTRSGINPTDWKARAGITRADPVGFQVPHQDGAGAVDALGPGVDGLVPGQRVWLWLAATDNPYGTAAEYCVVPAERAIPLPDGASDDLGSCLGVPALTAAHCLGGDPAALRGATVLVAGGAGAVGHFAIELAKHAGATVVSTVSSPGKADRAAAAGADVVVSYRHDDALERIQAAAPRCDRIVEVALGANLEISLGVARAGTVIAMYGNEDPDPVLPTRRLKAANVTIQYVLLYGVPAVELARAVAWVRAAVAEGALSSLPLAHYRLNEVVAAHEAMENGADTRATLVPGRD